VSTLALFLLVAGAQFAFHAFRWLRRRAEDREIRDVLEKLHAQDEARRKTFKFPMPPADPRDIAGWDAYWEVELETGGLHTRFGDVLIAHWDTPGLLATRGVRTVLCVGNGLSAEAASLAGKGFDVTALDVSPLAIRTAEQGWKTSDVNDTLRFVCGDLFDATACPGPFDAVIERCTLQLYSPDERTLGLERLTGRLAQRGLFVSHVHMGGWRPGQPREHYARPWLAAHGFREDPGAERMCRLTLMTG